MQKSRTLIKLLLFIALLIALPSTLFAYDTSYIKNYDVDIVVNKNNTYDINENITYHFASPTHGFYRTLYTRGNGGKKAIEIKSFTSSENIANKTKDRYSVTYAIGNRDRRVTGDQYYNIFYTYNIGDDENEGFDAFYFNLIGTEWQDSILNFTFKISFPPDANINPSQIQFFKGEYGSLSSDNITYRVDGNTIIGSARNISPRNALTILVPLEDGYFTDTQNPFDVGRALLILLLITSVIYLLITIICYLVFGREKLLIKVVSAYPPKGYTPLDVRYIYKRVFDSKAISGTILNFAERGFLKISYEKKSNILSKDKVVLKKIKDADSTFEREEKMIFDALFQNSTEVDTSVPNESLQLKVQAVGAMIRAKYNAGDKNIFEKKNKVISAFLLVFDALLIVLTLGIAYLLISETFIGGTPKLALVSFITSLICIVSGGAFAYNVNKKTDYYVDILGKILGLRDFIVTVEKDKIKALLDTDSEYFYKTLQYAIPLDVDEKWAKKFEGLNIAPPSYIEGYNSADGFFMYLYVSRLLSASSMVRNITLPQGRGQGGGGLHMGGGSIGGGFAGGGFGGGGGGRW